MALPICAIEREFCNGISANWKIEKLVGEKREKMAIPHIVVAWFKRGELHPYKMVVTQLVGKYCMFQVVEGLVLHLRIMKYQTINCFEEDIKP